MAYPTQHLAVTLPLIAVVPPRLRLPVLVGGVLIDVDHFLDVGLHKAGIAQSRSFILFHGLDVVAAVALSRPGAVATNSPLLPSAWHCTMRWIARWSAIG